MSKRGGIPPGTPRCGARKYGSGEPCGQPAGSGTNHRGEGYCKWHGGASPQHHKSLTIAGLKRDAVIYGGPLDTNPYEVLLSQLQQSAGHVAWLLAKLQTFTSSDQFLTREGRQWRAQYNEERKYLAHLSKTCIDLALTERVVRLSERQGEVMADVLTRALDVAGITGEQRKTILLEMAAGLRGKLARRGDENVNGAPPPLTMGALERWQHRDDTTGFELSEDQLARAVWWERQHLPERARILT